MSRLTVFADNDPSAPIFASEDTTAIAAELKRIGVRFERWQSPVALSPDDDADKILAAYRPYLDALMGESGAGSANVIKLTPDNPNAGAMRQKFLSEHIHIEDEVRFFVHGSGNFVMHVNGRIYDAHCAQGDLISVPARTKHWFDCGDKPSFTVLRVFTDSAGWAAHYTGDTISERFPVTVPVAA